jgi:hypothetical protein
LQENNTIKVESNVAVVTEEDSIGIKPDEVYAHSALCVKIDEPEVSLFLDKFWFVFFFPGTVCLSHNFQFGECT